MYYPDLTEYQPARNHYHKPFTFTEVFRIGWLENGYSYSQGGVEDEIVQKLKDLLVSAKTNVIRTRGIHQCDFCEVSANRFETIHIYHKGQEVALGLSELWVPGKEGIIYAAPTLIYHYIIEHNYKPPDVFLEAVNDFDLNSEWNGWETYLALVDEYRSRIKLD